MKAVEQRRHNLAAKHAAGQEEQAQIIERDLQESERQRRREAGWRGRGEQRRAAEADTSKNIARTQTRTRKGQETRRIATTLL
eukprot:766835-Hanusia_phi.AAC.2